MREGKQERCFILGHLPSTLPATGKERSQERSRRVNLPRPALQTSSTRDTVVSPPLPVGNCCDTEGSGWNLCSTWVLQEKRDTFKPLNTQITETPSGFERNTPQEAWERWSKQRLICMHKIESGERLHADTGVSYLQRVLGREPLWEWG